MMRHHGGVSGEVAGQGCGVGDGGGHVELHGRAGGRCRLDSALAFSPQTVAIAMGAEVERPMKTGPDQPGDQVK